MIKPPDYQRVMITLAQKFAAPRYAFFEQTGDAVGFPHRRADAVAVALWRSLGLEIQGFEIKISRQDWLRELKNPAKAESVFRYCDRWWLVIGNEEIVRTGELPSKWGLMVMHGKYLRTVMPAPELKPVALDHEFVVGLLRKVDQAAVGQLRMRAEYDRGYARATADLAYHKGRSEKLEKIIGQFELASGISIQYGDPPRLGATVRLILDGGAQQAINSLESTLARVQQLADSLSEQIKRIKGEAADRADGS